jgi:hypothetical protein
VNAGGEQEGLPEMNCYQHKLTLNTWNETEFLVLQTRGSVFCLLIKINRKETRAGEPTASAARRVFSASIPMPATRSVAVNSGSWRQGRAQDLGFGYSKIFKVQKEIGSLKFI